MIEWWFSSTNYPKNSRLTSLGPPDTQWGMSNFRCGRDGGHGTMRKATIIVSVIIELLLVVTASFTRSRYPGPIRGENCPGAGLSGPGNRLCGVSTPVRLAAWPAPPGTVPLSKALRSNPPGVQVYPIRRHGQGWSPLTTDQETRTLDLVPVYPCRLP